MKVLLFLNTGLDKNTTSGHLLKEVFDELLKNNSVHVIQMSKNAYNAQITDEYKDMNATIESVHTIPVKKNSFILRYLSAINNYLKCSKFVKRHKDCETVFIQSTKVTAVPVRIVRKHMKNASIILNIQDIFPLNLVCCGRVNKQSLVYRVLQGLQNYAYKHADRLITISEDMKDSLCREGVDKKKIDVVYNWSYQDAVYNRNEMDLSVVDHIFNDDFFNIVYAGNIGIMQNVDLLIDAANCLKAEKIWFHIIGDGLHKHELIKKTEEYGITNISFWPMQPSSVAPAIYCRADINIIPLIKDGYKTALPSKTATCLACQRPIIFAIGRESKFGQLVQKETNCPVINSDSYKELVSAIMDIKNGRIQCNTREFYLSSFQVSINRKEYSDIITNTKNVKKHF